MTSLAKRKTRLTFETSDCIRYRGKLREVVIEATEYTASIRLKGTRQHFEISWAGVFNQAVKIQRRETARRAQESEKQMNSHEYAHELKRLAEELLARPKFPVPYHAHSIHMTTKEEMIAGVKALGSGQKKHHVGDYFFDFIPAFAQASRFTLSVPQREVCRKVQEEVWACDPLLAQESEMPCESSSPQKN